MDDISFIKNNITIKISVSEPEKRAHILLRKKIYSEQYRDLSFHPDSYEKSIDEDIYDEHSIYINSYLNDDLIGTLRCIKDNENSLPIESDSSILCNIFRRNGQVIEIGRFAIKKKFRNDFDILFGLFEGISVFSRKNNVKYIVVQMPEHLLQFYKSIGFKIFGNPFKHPIVNELFYPGFLDFEDLNL